MNDEDKNGDDNFDVAEEHVKSSVPVAHKRVYS